MTIIFLGAIYTSSLHACLKFMKIELRNIESHFWNNICMCTATCYPVSFEHKTSWLAALNLQKFPGDSSLVAKRSSKISYLGGRKHYVSEVRNHPLRILMFMRSYGDVGWVVSTWQHGNTRPIGHYQGGDGNQLWVSSYGCAWLLRKKVGLCPLALIKTTKCRMKMAKFGWRL